MRLSLMPVIFSMVVLGCAEDAGPSGCAAPAEALEKISSLSNIVTKGQVAGRPSCIIYAGAQISACMYKGDRVYYFTNPASSTSTCGFIAYDCTGDELFNRGTSEADWATFESERTEVEVLWEKR